MARRNFENMNETQQLCKGAILSEMQKPAEEDIRQRAQGVSLSRMNRRIEVTPCRETGIPMAHVSSDDIWELTEYLSWQRVPVSYSYGGSDFVVSFMSMGCDAAQRLLDYWAERPGWRCEEAEQPASRNQDRLCWPL